MKYSALTIVILMSLLFSSCEDDELSTIISTETRDLSSFNKIHMDGVGDVDYIISPDFKIEITTHIDLMHDVDTYIRNGELHIDLDGRHKDIKTLDYTVYAPKVIEFKVKGVGDINCSDRIIVDHLTVLQDGVGSIFLDDVVATSVFARMSDVGDIELSGIAEQVSYRMDGVGSIQAFDLEAITGEARLEGVGDIEVNVSDDLTIFHDGVGKIYYLGNPDIHLSGDGGNIVKVN